MAQRWKERQVHRAYRDGKRGRFTELTEMKSEAGSPSSQRWKERQVHRAQREVDGEGESYLESTYLHGVQL